MQTAKETNLQHENQPVFSFLSHKVSICFSFLKSNAV